MKLLYSDQIALES